MTADASSDCTVAEVASPIRNALVGGPFGSNLVSKDYVSSGVPVIRGTNMGHGRWVNGDFVCVTDEKADSLSANCAKPGDIVFTQRGTLGQVAIIPEDGQARYLISQSQMKLTVDESKANALFLYYVFISPKQQEYIRNSAIQTGVPHTNLGILRNTPLSLPPLAEQKAVAAVLGALDDKIELNRKMNATLEAIARALFQSWFVDFDPVFAKLDGRQPIGMNEATAALFPAALVDSDLGPIPAGWDVRPVGNAVDCVGGGTPDTKTSAFWQPAEHAWSTPKDLSNLQSPVLLRTERKLSSEGLAKVSSGLLPEGTLLLSSRAPIGYLAIAQIPVAINQGYIAMTPGGILPPLFMLFWCQQNMDVIKSHANGSTFMEISKSAFRPLPALIPSLKVLTAFQKLAEPLFAQMVQNEMQSSTLATLRDTLLPKLLSGELRIPDVGNQVQDIL